MSKAQEGGSRCTYLSENRLQEVIAAITVMGLHVEYRQSVPSWVYRITGRREEDQPPGLAAHWKPVFEEHPEFFRPATANPGDIALIVRRSAPDKRARPPLTEPVLKLLIDTAIEFMASSSASEWIVDGEFHQHYRSAAP